MRTLAASGCRLRRRVVADRSAAAADRACRGRCRRCRRAVAYGTRDGGRPSFPFQRRRRRNAARRTRGRVDLEARDSSPAVVFARATTATRRWWPGMVRRPRDATAAVTVVPATMPT